MLLLVNSLIELRGDDMISYLKGELIGVEDDKVVIEVGGLGYGIFVPANLISNLPAIGSEIKLHTYLNIREDAMQLFGFMSKEDLKVYKLVISVNGIGPKGGLAILSELTPDELRFAVVSSDIKAISKAQGIGKKTAEKLIIELKDKLSLEDVLSCSSESDGVINQKSPIDNNGNEAVQALVSLGYDMSSSVKAVKSVENEAGALSVEEILKLALRQMMF